MKRTPSGQVARRYQTYGLLGGVAMGLLTGVLVGGPHFLEWPVSRSLILIFCFVAGGALIGWTFLAIVVGLIGGGFATSSKLLHDEDQLDDERRERSAIGDNDV